MTLLQLALDFLGLDQALACAKAAEAEVDIIEVGTPLLKSAGVQAVRMMRARFPKKLIFADTKTMDAGAIEAGLVLEAGADICSVCSAASRLTLFSAIREAHALGKKVLIDLLGVEDVLGAALRLEDMEADYICLHTGLDQQEAKGRYSVEGLRLLAQRLGVPLSVAGGITPTDVPELMSLAPAIIVVGAYVTASPEPAKAARQMRQAVEGAAREKD
jgi:3-hexulose-6-phosphate synthase